MIPEWIWLVIILSSAGVTIRNSDEWLVRHDLGNRGIVTMLLFDFVTSIFLAAGLVSMLYTDSAKYLLVYLLFVFLQELVHFTWRAFSRRADLSYESSVDCSRQRKKMALNDAILSVPYGLYFVVICTLLAHEMYSLTAELLVSSFGRSMADERIILATMIFCISMAVVSKLVWKKGVLSFFVSLPVFLCMAIYSNINHITDKLLLFTLLIYALGLWVYSELIIIQYVNRHNEAIAGSGEEEASLT